MDSSRRKTPRLTARFREALIWAAELHETQTRKGSDTPYVGHLMAVASTVIEHGGDEEQAIAALLHDAIEDQGGEETRQQIRRRFGDRVVAIVDACTDTDETPKPPWRVRKERYIAHLAEISEDALLISLADTQRSCATTSW
jgi:(p)ppGpp synthase/HD superfamily hydrolase